MRALTSRTAPLAGVIMVSLLAGAEAAGAQGAAGRGATVPRFALDIPALNTELPVKTIEGGNLVAQVVDQPGAKGGKRVVGARVAPIVLSASPTSIVPLLKAAIDGVPLDGRVLEADFDYKAQGGIEFRQAVATRIAFASLDGASRDACSVEIVLAPASAAPIKGGGDIRGKVGPKAKACMRSNFKVQLGALPMNRVAIVDSIVITRPAGAGGAAAGLERPTTVRKAAEGAAGEATASNVTLSVSLADLAAHQQWYEDVVVKGNSGTAKELTLDVVYLGPDMKDELFTLRGTGVGLVTLRRSFEANSEKIARFQLELYVDRWELVPGSLTVSSAP